MAKLRGIDFLVDVNEGSEAVPDWQTVAGQRGATLTIDGADIDATDKDSEWEDNLPGHRSWKLSGDGLYGETVAGLEEIEDRLMAGEQMQVRLMLPSGAKRVGMATVTSFEISPPHDGVATASYEFKGAGALEKEAAA